MLPGQGHCENLTYQQQQHLTFRSTDRLPGPGLSILHEFTLVFLPTIMKPVEQMKGPGTSRLDQQPRLPRCCLQEHQHLSHFLSCTGARPGAWPAVRAQLGSPQRCLDSPLLRGTLPTPVGPHVPGPLARGCECGLCAQTGRGCVSSSLLYKGADEQMAALLPAVSCPGDEMMLPVGSQ